MARSSACRHLPHDGEKRDVAAASFLCPSSLCLSQESRHGASAPSMMSLVAKCLPCPRTWAHWVPVTSTGMREKGVPSLFLLNVTQVAGRALQDCFGLPAPAPHREDRTRCAAFSLLRRKALLPPQPLSSASSSSISPSIIDSPLLQNDGSVASRPKGFRSSAWCLVPPAFRSSKYLSWKPLSAFW